MNKNGNKNKPEVLLEGKNPEKSGVFFENGIAFGSKKDSVVEPRWLTTTEAAAYLRVSISSIKTMVCRGQIRVHKIGRRNRFRIDELEQMFTPNYM